MRKKIIAADLFCGAGGTSSGLVAACEERGVELELIAINHWDVAIQTHSRNHPRAKHLCESLDNVKPKELVPGGRLNLLVASPPCQHHSRARGGKPVNDQMRSSAWRILDWATDLYIDSILMENVKEWCFPGDTAVLTKRGMLPISEIEIGDEVWTHNARWKPVTAKSKRLADTVSIKGYGNTIIETTENHEFYVRQFAPKITQSGKRGRHESRLLEPEWVRADRLADRDQSSAYTLQNSGYAWASPVELPRYWMRLPEKLAVDVRSPHFFYMIGRWLGDGWIKKRKQKQDVVRICANKPEADELERRLKMTGLTWYRKGHSPSVDVFDLSAPESRILIRWLTGHFGQYAHRKTLPAWIFGASVDQRNTLIEGYCDSDGDEQNGNELRTSSVSRCLAVGIRLLLHSLGIPASIHKKDAYSQPSVVDPDAQMDCRESFYVSWRRDRLWEKCRRSDLHLWGRVREVAPARQSVEVYDITVADDHSFIADGQVVHNCEWGPLGTNGKPLKSKKGETFQAFITSLRGLGYRVEYRVLNAANYGDPTTRERLFVIARRGNKPIIWPEPTHGPKSDSQRDLFEERKRWRAAREIIDWNIPGKSIFTRKKPLAPATLERIAAGLRKFGGAKAEPFLIILRNHMDAKSIDEPVPTVAAGGNHIGVCDPFVVEMRNGKTANSIEEPLSTVTTKGAHHALIEPFVLGQQSGSVARSVDNPVPTVAGGGAIALVEPFVVQFNGNRDRDKERSRSINEPVGTVTAGGNRFGIVEPFVVPMNRAKDQPRSVEDPLRTVTATSNDMGLVEPFIVPFFGEREGQEPRTLSIDAPLPAVTSHGAGALVEPFIITAGGPEGQDRNAKSVDQPLSTVLTDPHQALVEPFVIPTNHGDKDRRSHSIENPMPTVTSVDAWGLIEPFLTSYYGNGENSPVSDPVPTVTTKDRFALVEPDGVKFDIRFRMLQPHELARAQGFTDDYEFEGNREQIVKQIGNAVPRNTAKALCGVLIQ